MGDLNLRVLLLLIAFVLSACDKFELKGFVTTYEPVNERCTQSLDFKTPFKIHLEDTQYAIYAWGFTVGETENSDRFRRIAQRKWRW